MPSSISKRRITLLVAMLATCLASTTTLPAQSSASGAVEPPASSGGVRHDVAQPGDEVVTLRYFRIEKGSFDRFLAASRDGVWPYFEKMGARVVGMWLEIHPSGEGLPGADESPDYDEVWLMTRYASLDHWRATREMETLGGDGPDAGRCREALALRRSLTLETSLRFLRGLSWDNPPWYLPAVE